MSNISAGINAVAIRAIITLGEIEIKTPYILNFSVNKQRNEASTFSASLKISAESLSDTQHLSNLVTIRAGEMSREKLIFTGYCLQAEPTPCWDDPSFVILNVSGKDVLYRLDREKYTRRQVATKSKWALINSADASLYKKTAKFQLSAYEVITTTGGDFRNDFEKNSKNKDSALSLLKTSPLPEGSYTQPSIIISDPVYVDTNVEALA